VAQRRRDFGSDSTRANCDALRDGDSLVAGAIETFVSNS
jgi:hypothetical protein